MMSKKRLVLISVLTILLVVGGLYATYAINVFEEEVTPTEYDMAFNFDLSGSVTREMTIESGKTKVFDIDITNPYSDTVQYGVAYTLVSPTTLPSGVTIAQNSISKNSVVGKVGSNDTVSVSVVIENSGTESITISFSVINGYKNGGDLILKDGYYLVPLPDSLQTIINLGLADSVQTDTPDFSKVSYSTCDTSTDTTCETTVGIYAAKDDLGISYYFRGDVENNYVKFGKWNSNSSISDIYYGFYSENATTLRKEYSSLSECESGDEDGGYNFNCTFISRAEKDMYWRIVRINGDGTIRLIYDGTNSHVNGEISIDRAVGTSVFNDQAVDNAFVGYMNGTIDGEKFPNGTTNSTSYAEAHANITDSTIKDYLENKWYANNIKGTDYEQYISDTIYCNDREVSTVNSSYTGNGSGITQTWYKMSERLVSNSPATPRLTCNQPNDRFTLESSNFSIETNGMLDEPVGLITADEVALAGGVFPKKNLLYYLYTGDSYTTLSPYGITSLGHAQNIFVMQHNGGIGGTDCSVAWPDSGVRPVISLKADALKYDSATSNGSMEHPFVIAD